MSFARFTKGCCFFPSIFRSLQDCMTGRKPPLPSAPKPLPKVDADSISDASAGGNKASSLSPNRARTDTVALLAMRPSRAPPMRNDAAPSVPTPTPGPNGGVRVMLRPSKTAGALSPVHRPSPAPTRMPVFPKHRRPPTPQRTVSAPPGGGGDVSVSPTMPSSRPLNFPRPLSAALLPSKRADAPALALAPTLSRSVTPPQSNGTPLRKFDRETPRSPVSSSNFHSPNARLPRVGRKSPFLSARCPTSTSLKPPSSSLARANAGSRAFRLPPPRRPPGHKRAVSALPAQRGVFGTDCSRSTSPQTFQCPSPTKSPHRRVISLNTMDSGAYDSSVDENGGFGNSAFVPGAQIASRGVSECRELEERRGSPESIFDSSATSTEVHASGKALPLPCDSIQPVHTAVMTAVPETELLELSNESDASMQPPLNVSETSLSAEDTGQSQSHGPSSTTSATPSLPPPIPADVPTPFSPASASQSLLITADAELSNIRPTASPATIAMTPQIPAAVAAKDGESIHCASSKTQMVPSPVPVNVPTPLPSYAMRPKSPRMHDVSSSSAPLQVLAAAIMGSTRTLNEKVASVENQASNTVASDNPSRQYAAKNTPLPVPVSKALPLPPVGVVRSRMDTVTAMTMKPTRPPPKVGNQNKSSTALQCSTSSALNAPGSTVSSSAASKRSITSKLAQANNVEEHSEHALATGGSKNQEAIVSSELLSPMPTTLTRTRMDTVTALAMKPTRAPPKLADLRAASKCEHGIAKGQHRRVQSAKHPSNAPMFKTAGRRKSLSEIRDIAASEASFNLLDSEQDSLNSVSTTTAVAAPATPIVVMSTSKKLPPLPKQSKSERSLLSALSPRLRPSRPKVWRALTAAVFTPQPQLLPKPASTLTTNVQPRETSEHSGGTLTAEAPETRAHPQHPERSLTSEYYLPGSRDSLRATAPSSVGMTLKRVSGAMADSAHRTSQFLLDAGDADDGNVPQRATSMVIPRSTGAGVAFKRDNSHKRVASAMAAPLSRGLTQRVSPTSLRSDSILPSPKLFSRKNTLQKIALPGMTDASPTRQLSPDPQSDSTKLKTKTMPSTSGSTAQHSSQPPLETVHTALLSTSIVKSATQSLRTFSRVGFDKLRNVARSGISSALAASSKSHNGHRARQRDHSLPFSALSPTAAIPPPLPAGPKPLPHGCSPPLRAATSFPETRGRRRSKSVPMVSTIHVSASTMRPPPELVLVVDGDDADSLALEHCSANSSDFGVADVLVPPTPPAEALAPTLIDTPESMPSMNYDEGANEKGTGGKSVSDGAEDNSCGRYQY